MAILLTRNARKNIRRNREEERRKQRMRYIVTLNYDRTLKAKTYDIMSYLAAVNSTCTFIICIICVIDDRMPRIWSQNKAEK